MRALLSLLSRRGPDPRPVVARLGPAEPPVQVDRSMAVIGDVHGMDALLGRMLSALAAQAPDALIVFVGDLIDRGPGSAGVLARVAEMEAAGQAIALRGNHEEMLLDFLDAPEAAGSRWLQHGGMETLTSFDLHPVPDILQDPTALIDLSFALRQKLGPLERWLRACPVIHCNGTVACVHAGCDPARPMTGQDPRHLVWGHPAFERQTRRDGLWIAHGHTVVSGPRAMRGRIAVDTGAWAGGGLSAALIGSGAQPLRFLTVR